MLIEETISEHTREGEQIKQIEKNGQDECDLFPKFHVISKQREEFICHEEFIQVFLLSANIQNIVRMNH